MGRLLTSIAVLLAGAAAGRSLEAQDPRAALDRLHGLALDSIVGSSTVYFRPADRQRAVALQSPTTAGDGVDHFHVIAADDVPTAAGTSARARRGSRRMMQPRPEPARMFRLSPRRRCGTTNRAGTVRDDTLTLRLEARAVAWHPERPDGITHGRTDPRAGALNGVTALIGGSPNGGSIRADTVSPPAAASWGIRPEAVAPLSGPIAFCMTGERRSMPMHGILRIAMARAPELHVRGARTDPGRPVSYGAPEPPGQEAAMLRSANRAQATCVA